MNSLIYVLRGIIKGIDDFTDWGIQWFFKNFIENQPPPKGYSASFGRSRKLLARSHKGFCLTGTKSLSVTNSYRNSLIIGGTGVGKSSVVLLPSLYKMEGSFIVHDPSGELYKNSAGHLQKRGYTLKTLNFADPKNSSGFNPLSRIVDDSGIHRVSSLIIRTILGEPKGDPFWNLQSTGLLTFLIKLVKTRPIEEQTLVQARNYLNQLNTEPESLKKLVATIEHPTLLIELTSFLGYDEKVKAGIIATVASALQIFADESVAAVTSHDTLALQLFRVKKMALFIQNPITEQEYYSVLTSLFFEQFFGAILGRLPEKHEHDVFCLIDEAGVLYLPSLANTIANIRKYRAGLLLAIQDQNQLIAKYGQYQARTIQSNCYSTLYFTGQSGAMAVELESHLGRQEYQDQQGRTQIRPLITRDEIRTMPMNQGLLMVGHYKPMMVKLKPYYSNMWLSGKAIIPAPPLNHG